MDISQSRSGALVPGTVNLGTVSADTDSSTSDNNGTGQILSFPNWIQVYINTIPI
jgi:hypothetical protein